MRHAFDAELAAFERGDDERPPAPLAFARGLPDLPDVAEALANGHLLWEQAAAWTPEADPPPEAPRPSASPEDIAVELDMKSLMTCADVARARRRFMWENHPDRRRDIDAGLATRRGAIANMLLDRRLAHLGRGGLRSA